MKKSANSTPFAPNVADPVVESPQAGASYLSPIHVRVKDGPDGSYDSDWFNVHFYPDGPVCRPETDPAAFDQCLKPGPNRVDIRAGRRNSGSNQDEYSGWVQTAWFYVLTPPE